MKRFAALAATAALVCAAPAAARCNDNTGDVVAGALIGGIAGALIGDAIDDGNDRYVHGRRFHRRGHRRGGYRYSYRKDSGDEGAIIGGLLGAVTGGVIANEASKDCKPQVFGPPLHYSYGQGQTQTAPPPQQGVLRGGPNDPGLNQGEVFLDQNARRQGAQPRHNRPSQFQQTRLRTGGAIIPSTPECEWTTRLVRYGNGVVTTAPVEVCLDPYTGEWVPQS